MNLHFNLERNYGVEGDAFYSKKQKQNQQLMEW